MGQGSCIRPMLGDQRPGPDGGGEGETGGEAQGPTDKEMAEGDQRGKFCGEGGMGEGGLEGRSQDAGGGLGAAGGEGSEYRRGQNGGDAVGEKAAEFSRAGATRFWAVSSLRPRARPTDARERPSR